MFYCHLDQFIVKILTMDIVAKTFEIYFLAKISLMQCSFICFSGFELRILFEET